MAEEGSPAPPLELQGSVRLAQYLPAEGGWLRELPCELRRDPLTGRTGRVAHFLGFQLGVPDLGDAVEVSAPKCPFCPDRLLTVTPRLPGRLGLGERLQRGEAVLFPNLSPYDRFSAVTALTHAHFLPPSAFTADHLADGIQVAQEYFRAARSLAPGYQGLITWNYMPLAGATQVHPHMQVFFSDRLGHLLEEENGASADYFRAHGRCYWLELAERERQLQSRWLGSGEHVQAFTAFVSRSLISDVQLVFREVERLEDAPPEAVRELALNLTWALAHFEREGVRGFNLSLAGAGPETPPGAVRLRARLSPRIQLDVRTGASDCTAWLEMLDEGVMLRSPEALAKQLGPQFASAALAG